MLNELKNLKELINALHEMYTTGAYGNIHPNFAAEQLDTILGQLSEVTTLAEAKLRFALKKTIPISLSECKLPKEIPNKFTASGSAFFFLAALHHINPKVPLDHYKSGDKLMDDYMSYDFNTPNKLTLVFKNPELGWPGIKLSVITIENKKLVTKYFRYAKPALEYVESKLKDE